MLLQVQMLSGGVALATFVEDDFSETLKEFYPEDDLSELDADAQAFILEARRES